MPDFPPWVVEALERGATVGFFLACLAVAWLAKQLGEREKARAQADEKHFATLQAMQPMIREMTAAMAANTAIVANANATTASAVERLNERIFATHYPRQKSEGQ